jgi:hypothetical protein
VSVMRRQAGLTALVAASVALAVLAVAYHVHDLSGVRADDSAPAISAVCPVCTLVHISSAPAVGCVGSRVPCFEQRLKPLDAATLPRELSLCSHASRAPPAPHGLGA